MRLLLDDKVRSYLKKKAKDGEITLGVFETGNSWIPFRESVVTLGMPEDDRAYKILREEGWTFYIDELLWERNEELHLVKRGFLGIQYLSLNDPKV